MPSFINLLNKSSEDFKAFGERFDAHSQRAHQWIESYIKEKSLKGGAKDRAEFDANLCRFQLNDLRKHFSSDELAYIAAESLVNQLMMTQQIEMMKVRKLQ